MSLAQWENLPPSSLNWVFQGLGREEVAKVVRKCQKCTLTERIESQQGSCRSISRQYDEQAGEISHALEQRRVHLPLRIWVVCR